MMPEQFLAFVVLQQARADLQSRCRWQREDARAFFRGDEAMLTFWGEAAGVEVGLVQRYAATVAQAPGRGELWPQQLALFV